MLSKNRFNQHYGSFRAFAIRSVYVAILTTIVLESMHIYNNYLYELERHAWYIQNNETICYFDNESDSCILLQLELQKSPFMATIENYGYNLKSCIRLTCFDLFMLIVDDWQLTLLYIPITFGIVAIIMDLSRRFHYCYNNNNNNYKQKKVE